MQPPPNMVPETVEVLPDDGMLQPPPAVDARGYGPFDPAAQYQPGPAPPQSTALTVPEPPPAERLPADRLMKMYLAWEQAKTQEIHEQHLARRYYHGKQWTDAEIRALKARKQPVTVKNRIKRKVDFLVGVEQRLRRDPKCFPRNPNGEQAAWVATAGVRFVEDDTKWPAVASEASSEALVSGMTAVWQGVEMGRDRLEIRKRTVAADRWWYDPRSERWDFSDARYLGEHQWLDIDEAIEMLSIFPGAPEMIEALANAHQPGSMTGLPAEFDKEKNWVDTNQRRIRLVSIWYKWKGEWLFDYLSGGVSLLNEQNDCLSPYLDEEDKSTHPYSPWSPYVDERGDRYGVVRDMIPIQDSINKRSSKALHMLNVRQTIGEKGAVDDVDAMKRELAKPDGHVEVSPGEKRFEIVDQSAQIQGQLELLQEDKAEIENLGPNPGLIGRGVEKQSGRAILAQQNSGMTELSPVFERMREWKLNVYRKDWQLMRQFWRGERWIRITGEADAVQFLAINRIAEDPATGRVSVENALADMHVDLILDEGPDTITMQEELLAQLSDMAQSGVPIPPQVLIKLSGVKTQVKEELLAAFEQQAQQPDPAEQQAEIERMKHEQAMVKGQQDMEASRAKTEQELQLRAIDLDKAKIDLEKAEVELEKLENEPEGADDGKSNGGKPRRTRRARKDAESEELKSLLRQMGEQMQQNRAMAEAILQRRAARQAPAGPMGPMNGG